MVIAKNMLKIEGNPFSSGGFSNVYRAKLDGNIYCYKEFTRGYPEDIVKNITSMTDVNFSSEFLVPLCMVTDESGKIIGYLSNYDEKLKGFDNKKKIVMLKKAREAIEKLHTEYGYIHGDLTIQNMLFDDNDNAYLIDFDSALKMGQTVGSRNSFLWPVQLFLGYHPLDFSVDAYIFNITTLACLNNIDLTMMLRQLASGKINVPDINAKVRTLSKELLSYEERKPYSGEYIIDYV